MDNEIIENKTNQSLLRKAGITRQCIYIVSIISVLAYILGCIVGFFALKDINIIKKMDCCGIVFDAMNETYPENFFECELLSKPNNETYDYEDYEDYDQLLGEDLLNN